MRVQGAYKADKHATPTHPTSIVVMCLMETEERKPEISRQKRRGGFQFWFERGEWRGMPNRERKRVPDDRSDILKGSLPKSKIYDHPLSSLRVLFDPSFRSSCVILDLQVSFYNVVYFTLNTALNTFYIWPISPQFIISLGQKVGLLCQLCPITLQVLSASRYPASLPVFFANR